ncbi:hypothetical protein [Maribellus sp. YY47]|uniref:hypothetical protein n=1 Tax=Maribellus sp. YY47 TaxID=2929486 RepID=UPI002001BABA|nr:hypothetical protein [Maribellus sp. YY47]MCK3686196.1 hypothetical protein [Maribellus sp. YY47]
MKTTVKQLATGTFLIVLLLMGNTKAEASERKVFSKTYTETALQLENWMTEETFWNTNSTARIEFAPEIEVGLQLEDWMLDDSNWKVSSPEDEPRLTIEHWMINKKFWR